MQTISTDLRAVLRSSPRLTVRVEAWRAGRLLADDLPVASGNVTTSAGQAVRGAASVVIADPGGLYAPKSPADALAPYGQELRIKIGARVGSVVEWVQLGVYPIQEVTVQESYGTKQRPTEGTRKFWHSKGASVSVRAADRAQIVADARFLSREQPTSTSVYAECQRLLSACGVPWKQPASGDVLLTTTSVTYDDDRLGALSKLGDLINCEPAATPDGSITMRTQKATLANAVWALSGADDAVLVNISRTMSRTSLYNIAVVRGGSGETAVQAVAFPTEYDADTHPWGVFGQKPFYESSNLLQTQRAVDDAARWKLDSLMSQQRLVLPIDIVPNPALEVGDIVSVPAPRRDVLGEVRSIAINLAPAAMRVTVAVDARAFSEAL